jgi:F-type H+-transporting ATPase subunit delta
LRDATIARNYAEALFAAGRPTGEIEAFAAVMEALAGAVEADDRIGLVLESPRVPKAEKVQILRRALAGRAPDVFIRFVGAVVRRGRQGLFGAISREYQKLADVEFNRVHAGVTLARAPDRALQEAIRRALSDALGKEVVPHFREDAALLGGILVRVGDRVMDGSVRNRLIRLRRQMLGA